MSYDILTNPRIKSKTEAKQAMFLIRNNFRFNRTLIDKEE